ncbi:hypothetical protein PsorP6_015179 [Peronosclerospora sorghi]|uniref:Uncharacterized protein n=1 Tax=Peronosclerospora sorghi TaxID=230839 RepID=A0ACC0VSQ9_9STRA|nr:hypothetical protein PsorP6_015179 [Peronosclerospora sorghi]
MNVPTRSSNSVIVSSMKAMSNTMSAPGVNASTLLQHLVYTMVTQHWFIFLLEVFHQRFQHFRPRYFVTERRLFQQVVGTVMHTILRIGERMFDVEPFVADQTCREMKRSLMRRFLEESLRTIVKRVSVQGLMIVNVPAGIHAGEVVVEKDNLGGNSFVAARFGLFLRQLGMGNILQQITNLIFVKLSDNSDDKKIIAEYDKADKIVKNIRCDGVSFVDSSSIEVGKRYRISMHKEIAEFTVIELKKELKWKADVEGLKGLEEDLAALLLRLATVPKWVTTIVALNVKENAGITVQAVTYKHTVYISPYKETKHVCHSHTNAANKSSPRLAGPCNKNGTISFSPEPELNSNTPCEAVYHESCT